MAIGLMMLPFALIFEKNPDLGSAIVLVPTGLAMMYVGGVPKKRYLALLVGSVGLLERAVYRGHFVRAAFAAISHEDLTRNNGCWFISAVSYFTSPDGTTPAESQSTSPIPNKAMITTSGRRCIAVGSGGLTGKRLAARDAKCARLFAAGGGSQRLHFFSVIAEEEGFVGSVIVLALYAVVLFAGLRIAGQARDRSGQTRGCGRGHAHLQPRLY